jgi:hypothetical protein
LHASKGANRGRAGQVLDSVDSGANSSAISALDRISSEGLPRKDH